MGIKHATLRILGRKYVDFIVLLALYMDALRAEQTYLKNPAKINQLLGGQTWRSLWQSARLEGIGFPRFLAEQLAESMARMGYIPPPFYSMRKVFFYEKNYPLYALGLFSRSPVAYNFWDQALQYTDDQLGLF
jgi:hypothetical protein